MKAIIFTAICALVLARPADAAIRISLNAKWENRTWEVHNSNGSITIPAQVPGGIYTDLQASGILDENLFNRFNDHDYRWVANENWTYKTTFELSAEVLSQAVINLVFHGLDTIGEVYVNGNLTANVNNMFVRYVIPIKEIAKEGANTLEIRFQSPIIAARNLYENQKESYVIPPECVPDEYQGECHVQHLRKMQASFSWDWAPAFPSVGIWKSVEIEAFNRTLIRNIYVTTAKDRTEDEDTWTANVTVTLESATDEMHPSVLLVSILPTKYGHPMARTRTSSFVRDENKNRTFSSTSSFNFKADSIIEWWPNNYAEERKMYRAEASFYSYDDEGEKEEEDTKQADFGFRTAEIIEEQLQPDKEGLSFYLKINGVPIFAKGSNWIPVHILPELSVDETRIRHLLLSVKEANMNMLRVHGVGLYESDLFYQLADELGIMIWQDAAFASAMYPADDEFLQSVSLEIEQQVQRLRNHPSLVVWAGNNENEEFLATNYFGTDSNFTLYKNDYVKLYVDTMGKIIHENDPLRYFEVSCFSNGIHSIEEGYIADDPGSSLYGDYHNFDYGGDPWDYSHYPDVRFATEFGFQSWPSFKTISKVSIPEDWNMQSEFCTQRQHHANGLNEITRFIKLHFPLPDDDDSEEYFKTYIHYSQIYQALAVKTEAEKYRRDRSKLTEDNKGHTMGALYWNLNDIWQAPTWSSIDYDGRWKVLHYYAKKFFSPVLVSPIKVSEQQLDVYIISDLLIDVQVSLDIFLYSWDSIEPVNVTSSTHLVRNSSSSIYSTYNLPNLEPNSYFVYFLLSGPDLSSDNIYYPTPFTEVANVSPPNVTVTKIEQASNGTDLIITLETDRIAPFVWLETDVQGQFSDNGFTLIGGEIEIVFTNRNDPVNIDDFTNTLTVRTLFSN